MDKPKNLTPDGVLLKSRFDKLIDICGGVKRAEHLTRVGQRVLYDYANPDRIELFAPVDIVADLEKASGQHPVTESLALIAGGYFIKPAPGAKVRVNFGAVMPSVGRDIGELLKNAYAAVEDGKFTAQEIAQLRSDIERTISDLCLARGVLDGAAQ